YYLHIPKCGSSFATTLVQFACPQLFSKGKMEGSEMVMEPTNFMKDFPLSEWCPGGFDTFHSGHCGAPTEVVADRPGNIAMMVRDPVERLVSGFLHNFHDCPEMHSLYSVDPDGLPWYSVPSGPWEGNSAELDHMLFQYGTCVEGCTVKQINGRECLMDSSRRPLEEEIELALNVVAKIGFIGITGRWEESVSLWRRMFGGNYSSAVLGNTRPSNQGDLRRRLSQRLRESGWRDYADDAFFAAAERVFNERMQLYDIR
ncbi:unnamed protein product, partial [Phaeothamnion confervicola]